MRLLGKIIKTYKAKKKFLTRIKMINISVKMYGNNGVEVIMNNNGILWLIEKHTKEES